MKVYKVFKNGKQTNSWTSEFSDENHWEPSFGAPGEYELVVEDLPDLSESMRLKQEKREAALARLKSADPNKAGTIAQLRTIVSDLLEVFNG